MANEAPLPIEHDFPSKRDYLMACARHPHARPRVHLAETQLDVDRQDAPVTIAYTYEPNRRAVGILGVFRGAVEVVLSPRETGYIKTWLRSIQHMEPTDAD